MRRPADAESVLFPKHPLTAGSCARTFRSRTYNRRRHFASKAYPYIYSTLDLNKQNKNHPRKHQILTRNVRPNGFANRQIVLPRHCVLCTYLYVKRNGIFCFFSHVPRSLSDDTVGELFRDLRYRVSLKGEVPHQLCIVKEEQAVTC